MSGLTSPQVKTVEEHGESKQHRRPQRHNKHPRPGEVECNLLAEVVAYLPQRLKATWLGPGSVQLVTRVLGTAAGWRRRASSLLVRRRHVSPGVVVLKVSSEVLACRQSGQFHGVVVLIKPRPDHLQYFLLAGIVLTRLVVHWIRPVTVAFMKHVQQTYAQPQSTSSVIVKRQ